MLEKECMCMYKWVALEWISNEILLQSTGNYMQSLMMQHDHVRKRMYTCMTAVQVKN